MLEIARVLRLFFPTLSKLLSGFGAYIQIVEIKAYEILCQSL
jgi:hypothetical protein